MRQSREDAAFAAESLFTGVAAQCGVQELDRDLAFEAAVAAAGEPYAAHSALADLPLERIRPQRMTGER